MISLLSLFTLLIGIFMLDAQEPGCCASAGLAESESGNEPAPPIVEIRRTARNSRILRVVLDGIKV
jgi:hypothetical protein